jgi:hypothetical protein
LRVHPTDKGFPVRRFEEVDPTEVFGGGLRGQVKVDIPDPIDDPALDERPLIQARVELERCDRDMPSHGLPVDDGPSRATYLPDEQIEQRSHVIHEQVGSVGLGAEARCGERITPVLQVRSQGRIVRATIVTVGKEDEPAVPAGRHLDQVTPTLVGAPPAHGAAITGQDSLLGGASGESQEDYGHESATSARRHYVRLLGTVMALSSVRPTCRLSGRRIARVGHHHV